MKKVRKVKGKVRAIAFLIVLVGLGLAIDKVLCEERDKGARERRESHAIHTGIFDLQCSRGGTVG